jgi:polyisoprenyl-phosphate glycosyltransferase
MGISNMNHFKQGISFLIPAYNEEDAIYSTIEELDNALKMANIDYEIIIVNDGSTDNTLKNAKKYKSVTIISHPINVGYGRSIKSGIENSKYQWIGITDADGTYAMDSIPELLRNMEKGFDMVIGARQNLIAHDSRFKAFFRMIYKFSVKICFHADLVDPNSGFRIFSKDKAKSYFPFLCDTFSFTTSLTVLFYGGGAFINHIPIEYKIRIGNTKVSPFKDSVKTILYIIQGLTFYNPLKFFLLLAVVIITLVCFPAMLLALYSMHTLSLYYIIFGFLMVLLIAIGILVDTVRISMLKRGK